MPERNEPDDRPDSAAATPEQPAQEAAAQEAATVAIPHVSRATPTRVAPATPPPSGAGAARVSEPAPRRRRRWPLLLGAVVVVAGVATAAVLLVHRVGGDSTETEVRSAITGYMTAVDRGDLTALRAGTCGELADYYRQVDADEFAQVFTSANSDRAVPVLDTVDAVAVTGDTALAQVTVHMANDAGVTSVRSFALEGGDGTWRVCS